MQAQVDSFSYFFCYFHLRHSKNNSQLKSHHHLFLLLIVDCRLVCFSLSFSKQKIVVFRLAIKKMLKMEMEREREKLKPMLISFSFHLKMFDYKQAENLQSLLYLFSVTYSKVFSTFLLFPIYSKS